MGGADLDVCERGRDRTQPVECAASRAYIKQRWGTEMSDADRYYLHRIFWGER